MGNNIAGDTQFVYIGKPAWHSLGKGYPEGACVSATQALQDNLELDIQEMPLFLSDGTKTDYKAIVRSANSYDDRRIFGVVDKDYHSLYPNVLCPLFDECVRKEDGSPAGIDTMGALGNGEVFFMTSVLPDFSINGDTIKNWLFIENDMQGKGGVNVYVANLRVVCQNTLVAAKMAALETHRIVHGQYIEDDTRAWLTFVWEKAMERRAILQQAYEVLVQREVTYQEKEEFKFNVFNVPNCPNEDDMPYAIYQRYIKTYETTAKRMDAFRGAFDRRWDGAALGYEDRKPRTAWDMWQCQTEVENHFSTRNQKEVTRAGSIMHGDRRKRIEAGFEYAYALVK